MFDEESVYFITGRTIQGRYLVHPKERLRDLVGGVIARAQVHYPEVELYNLVFMSNHYHLILYKIPQLPCILAQQENSASAQRL